MFIFNCIFAVKRNQYIVNYQLIQDEWYSFTAIGLKIVPERKTFFCIKKIEFRSTKSETMTKRKMFKTVY